jgi:hypothetical protein
LLDAGEFVANVIGTDKAAAPRLRLRFPHGEFSVGGFGDVGALPAGGGLALTVTS